MENYRELLQELMDAIDSGIPVDRIRNSALAVRVDAALEQPSPEDTELTNQELLRCAKIATPCYDLKAWERELRMMRSAISADRSLRNNR